jgi:P4 family phage/plasmid primase-like protien
MEPLLRPETIARILMRLDKYVAILDPTGEWTSADLYRYFNGVFSPDGDSFARRAANKILGSSTSTEYIDDFVLPSIRWLTIADYDGVNKHSPELVNAKNGMICWRTGELLQHDPKYLSLNQIPVSWEPDAKSAELDEFLDGVLPSDALQTAEEFVGYLLVPDTSLAKALVLVGKDENGKRAFVDLVKALLGKDNFVSLSLHSITNERFALEKLLGKLANFCHELTELEDTWLFQQLVSGSEFRVENEDHTKFAFHPYARFVFVTDKMPRSRDCSQAFFDRLLFLIFDGESTSHDCTLAEKPGVLKALLVRAIAGLRRLMERGRFDPPKSSVEVLEEYRRACEVSAALWD